LKEAEAKGEGARQRLEQYLREGKRRGAAMPPVEKEVEGKGVKVRAEGGREADYVRTAAVLKALGVKQWNRKEDQLQLTGGALDALMRLESVCAALGVCQK
jgi:hypothetical protein